MRRGPRRAVPLGRGRTRPLLPVLARSATGGGDRGRGGRGCPLTTDPPTVKLVPIADVLRLAELGVAMRKAQRDYFQARKEQPHCDHTTAYRAARSAESRFDAACRDVLSQ